MPATPSWPSRRCAPTTRRRQPAAPRRRRSSRHLQRLERLPGRLCAATPASVPHRRHPPDRRDVPGCAPETPSDPARSAHARRGPPSPRRTRTAAAPSTAADAPPSPTTQDTPHTTAPTSTTPATSADAPHAGVPHSRHTRSRAATARHVQRCRHRAARRWMPRARPRLTCVGNRTQLRAVVGRLIVGHDDPFTASVSRRRHSCLPSVVPFIHLGPQPLRPDNPVLTRPQLPLLLAADAAALVVVVLARVTSPAPRAVPATPAPTRRSCCLRAGYRRAGYR